jgi:hypothetical protein
VCLGVGSAREVGSSRVGCQAKSAWVVSSVGLTLCDGFARSLRRECALRHSLGSSTCTYGSSSTWTTTPRAWSSGAAQPLRESRAAHSNQQHTTASKELEERS